MELSPITLPFGAAPAWLPDLADADEYLRERSEMFWAWEFVRRNPEYQSDYATWMQMTGMDARYIKQEQGRLMEKWGCSICDPSSSPRFFGGCGQEIFDLPPDFLELESEETVAFGDPKRFYNGCSGDTRTVLRHGGTPSEDSFHIFARIDVRYPLEQQMDELRAKYKMIRESYVDVGGLDAVNAKKPQLRKLPDYLRVYDAVWKGSPQRDIAKVVCPKKKWAPPGCAASKQIGRDLCEARRLVDGGYRDLLKWSGFGRRC